MGCIITSVWRFQMKLSEFAALQLGSEIVEEFEEWENTSEEPHDYDEDKTAEDDEDRFIDNEEDYEYREKWPWYKKTVPKHVLDLLANIKDDAFYNIPGIDIVLRDFYARNVYEFYCNPTDVKEWLGSLARQYIRLVDQAPDKMKFQMVDISSEGMDLGWDGHVWCLVRGISHPLSKLFGFNMNELDACYLSCLLKELNEEIVLDE